ncbi:MAG: (2Fe-2S)-binding protein [Oscillospiraceae bacterium]|nr:(2Fe-2S)-binding protein [Oscillospiraceae bacterium]
MIEFVLNGEKVSWEGPDTERLLDVLREDFRLTGVKCGCKEGECGACSVIFDGELANSCLIPMAKADGAEIMTIEGLRELDCFRVLDRAFAEPAAVQCGFCTPGMVLAAYSLLKKNPHPDENEIRDGLSGNLCRCTGYRAIVEAVKLAAKEGGKW